jgi:uncharacterized protein YjbJ (UPF0337 family)
MNQAQFQSFWDQLKGPLQKEWGKLTDEDLPEIAGNMETFTRTIDKRYGEVQGEVSKWAQRRYAHWIGWYEGYEQSEPASRPAQKALS